MTPTERESAMVALLSEALDRLMETCAGMGNLAAVKAREMNLPARIANAIQTVHDTRAAGSALAPAQQADTDKETP